MSTTTEQTATVRPRRTSFAYALRNQVFLHVSQGKWFLAIVLVLAVAATVAVAVTGEPDRSIVQFGRLAFLWFPFGMAIVVVSGLLEPHIAFGRTRAGFARAAVVTGLIVAVTYGALLTLLLVLEQAVFRAFGWTHRVTEDGWYANGEPSAAVALVGLGSLFAAGQMSGLLVAVVYRRIGAGRGTLALPLTVGPLVAALLVMAASEGGNAPAWAGVATCAAVALVSALVFDRLVGPRGERRGGRHQPGAHALDRIPLAGVGSYELLPELLPPPRGHPAHRP